MDQKRGEGLAIDYKGHLNSLSDLPKGDLPPPAVQYDEAGDLNELVEAVLSWHWPLLIFILGLYLVKSLRTGEWIHLPTIIGFIAIFPGLFLHEWIHALCFPRQASVHIYRKLSQGVLLAYSTFPVSRGRFISLYLYFSGAGLAVGGGPPGHLVPVHGYRHFCPFVFALWGRLALWCSWRFL